MTPPLNSNAVPAFLSAIALALLSSLDPTAAPAETAPSPLLSAGPIGFATVNGATTGGGKTPPVTVTTFARLSEAAQDPRPRVIIISGVIETEGGSGLKIASNKTLLGADKNAGLHGGLQIHGVTNVIVRNLNIHGVWPNPGPDDTISVRESHHLWLDHLNIWDAGDGNLDLTRESSYATVSWCKFWYTRQDHPHRLCALIGSGGGDHPEDWGRLKVTYHHNWFADLVDQRMPRLMYGQAHIFNNYYHCPGNTYCVGVGSYGAALLENNYFQDVHNPHIHMYDVYCHLTARGNIYDHTTGKQDSGPAGARHAPGQSFQVTPFTHPPYDYPLDQAEDIPGLVTQYAGPQ